MDLGGDGSCEDDENARMTAKIVRTKFSVHISPSFGRFDAGYGRFGLLTTDPDALTARFGNKG